MNNHFLIVVTLVALGQFAAAGVTAQSDHPNNANRANLNDKVPAADRAFARKAAEDGLVEVEMGELAAQSGSSPAVKNFGKHVVEENSKINDELKAEAAKENIALPTEKNDENLGTYDSQLEMNDKDSGTYDNLMALTGADFDRAYMRAIVANYAKYVSEFDKEAKDGRNTAIKDFAADTAPTLQEQLKTARDLQSSISQTSSKGPTKSAHPS